MGLLLPEIPDEWGHLVQWLHEMGVCGQGFAGAVPLSFAEIQAWARMTDLTLTRFEASTLRAMSAVYARVASDKASECPMEDDEDIVAAQDSAAIAQWMRFAKKTSA